MFPLHNPFLKISCFPNYKNSNKQPSLQQRLLQNGKWLIFYITILRQFSCINFFLLLLFGLDRLTELANSMTMKFQKNIAKRGSVPETSVKKGKDYPVGPILLGFFLFVVVGSCMLFLTVLPLLKKSLKHSSIYMVFNLFFCLLSRWHFFFVILILCLCCELA